jgi:Inverse autotransporter, beta-domain
LFIFSFKKVLYQLPRFFMIGDLMKTLLKTSLLSYLAISTLVVSAAAPEKPWATSVESSATLQALPSVGVLLGSQGNNAHRRVSMEGLWPFFLEEQQLLFLQGGWQRQQQRNLLSFGVGWRYFPEIRWGVGCNLFYDQETTRHPRRLGWGAEAWWQLLTLAVNGYLPVNGWRNAHDLTGYQQRLASGYEVTLRGYLPALPHLGASIRTARYFGDEVTLGSEQQRYRNPQRWSWGMSYTPIPLLTLAYQRQTGRGDAKHQIRAVLSYRFSLPLSQQLDPQQVSWLHSAEGQRLTHVQRERLMAFTCSKTADSAVPPRERSPSSTIAALAAGSTLRAEAPEFVPSRRSSLELPHNGDISFEDYESANGSWIE